jgi:hypothetical protein
LALAVCLPVIAQDFRAEVNGIVRDTQGGVVPKVAIEATNLATNEVSHALTNESGYYALPVLPIGAYRIAATAAGFKKAVRERVELRVGEHVQQDFQLEVGALAEQITVTAETELLQTVASDKGQVVSEENVHDLPSVGRNPFLIAAAASGAQFNIGANALSRSARPFDSGNNIAETLSINGGRLGASDLLLDGVPDTGTETTSAANMAFVPNPDATQEFRIETSNYDAQYGRTAGGTVSVSLKSGTNNYHGVAYWYSRNDALAANTLDANRINTKRAAFKWNQPGFELDGPIVIPHLYNGHNKTFFMYSYEIIRDKIPSPLSTTVPMPDQLAGNFNTTLQSNLQPITIYDPLSTVQTGTSTYTRKAFAGNVIPPSQMNPVAVKIASYIPKPNLGTPGTLSYQTNNLVVSPNARTDAYDAHIFRLDQVINDKERFFSRFVRGNRTEQNPTNGFAEAAASPQYNDGRFSQGANFDLTSTLSPSMVLTSRVAYLRHDLWINLYSSGFDYTKLGFPSSLAGQVPLYFPSIAISGDYTFGAGRSYGNQLSFSSSWAWSEFVNKNIGRHSLKFGGEVRSILDNINSPTSSFGQFAFTATFTQANPLSASGANGNAVASFLLGYPNSGSVPVNPALAYGYHYYGTFVQDDWRIAKNVTLSLGLRWDYESPVTERNNQMNAGFDPSATSPLQVPGYNLTGGLLFTGSNNRMPYQRDLNNFQPRAGLAWHPTPKTVVRAGYGLSYLATFTPAGTQGFSTSTPYVATAGGTVFLSGNSLSNPYPTGILMPTGSSLGLSTFLGQSITVVNRDRVIPKVHQFSLGIQREVGWRTVVEVSYVGSRSQSLDVGKQIDDVTLAQLLQYGAALSGSKTNPFAGLLPGTGINGATTTLQQTLRPYPQFTGITENNIPTGKSWYNAMQVSVNKRLSQGLNFQVNYTWSKWMDATSYLNNQDLITDTPARTLNGQDTPHRLTIGGNWDLPMFKHSHGIVAVLLKGWQANGLFMREVGFPLGTPSGYYSSGISAALANPTHTRDFNTCTITTTGARQNCASADEPYAWIQQPPSTLRTLSQRLQTIRPPIVPSVDVSLFKAFTLRENLRLQFRAEAFNATNSPQLGNPSTSMTSATAGLISPSMSNDPRAIQLALKLLF